MKNHLTTPDSVNITLNSDEALVLFEFIARLNQQLDSTLFEDRAEQRVLWDVEAMLETQLSASFQNDYFNLLKKAREKVRDQE